MRQICTRWLSLLIGGATLVVAGCTQPEAQGLDQSQPVAVVPVAPVTSYVRMSTTTLPTAPPEQVIDCVEYTQFMAFIGDPEMLDFWNSVGQNEARLRSTCEQLGRTDPAYLASFSTRRADAEAYMNAQSTTTATPTTPPPSTVPPQTSPPPTNPPPTNPPPTDAPVVQPVQSSCDPNYDGACVPIASDVDCAGGSGNGPEYVRGPVYVIGNDVYGLDSDDDGIGCE